MPPKKRTTASASSSKQKKLDSFFTAKTEKNDEPATTPTTPAPEAAAPSIETASVNTTPPSENSTTATSSNDNEKSAENEAPSEPPAKKRRVTRSASKKKAASKKSKEDVEEEVLEDLEASEPEAEFIDDDEEEETPKKKGKKKASSKTETPKKRGRKSTAETKKTTTKRKKKTSEDIQEATLQETPSHVFSVAAFPNFLPQRPKNFKKSSRSTLYHSVEDFSHLKIIYPTWRPTIDTVVYEDLPAPAPIDVCLNADESADTAKKYSVPAFSSTMFDSKQGYFMNTGLNMPVFSGISWCYTSPSHGSYAAIASYSQSVPHLVAKRYPPLKNKIQIWSFGKLGKEPTSTPRVAMNIEYDHNMIWAMDWMPADELCESNASAASAGGCRRLGVLAIVCADGALCVMTVPKPEDVVAKHPSANPSNTIIPTITLKSMVTHELEHYAMKDDTDAINRVGLEDDDSSDEDEGDEAPILVQFENEGKLLMYSCAWSKDLRYLATGCHDGSVIIWCVNHNATGTDYLTKALHMRAHVDRYAGLVRSIAWNTIDPNVFATAGYDGLIKVWDVRDPFEPHTDHSISRLWINDVAWPNNSNAYLCSAMEGAIKQFDARDIVVAACKVTDHAIWSLSVSFSKACVVYCQADGAIGLLSMECDGTIKQRPKEWMDVNIGHTNVVEQENTKQNMLCVSLPYNASQPEKEEAIKIAKANLVLSEGDTIPLRTKTGKISKKQVKAKVVPDPRVAWNKIQFIPSNEEHVRNWCLVGGPSGLLMLLYISDSYE